MGCAGWIAVGNPSHQLLIEKHNSRIHPGLSCLRFAEKHSNGQGASQGFPSARFARP
jgi:hypothetical protein